MANRKTKPAAKQAAKKKPAAKTRAAPKRPPEPEIQVNRMTKTEETRPDNADPGESQDAVQTEETQAERDAAGEARRAQVMTPRGSVDLEEYEPHHEPLEHEGFDHHAAEEQRQAELAAQREEHNDRTGDASR